MIKNVPVVSHLLLLGVAFFVLVSVVYIWYVLPSPKARAEQETAVTLPSTDKTTVPLNCRYGALIKSSSQVPYLEMVKASWTANFTVIFSPLLPEGIEYVPMIRLGQSVDPNTGERLPLYYLHTPPLNDNPGGLGPIIANNPGRLWLVGNEVDRVFWQDDVMPDVYAIAYHDVYHFIKERDPSAQVAPSGLVEVTPGRMQYLDIVWNSYIDRYNVTMPVDVWNMHIYVLPEIRADGLPSRAAIALGTDPSLGILESDLTPNQCDDDNVYCYAEHDDMSIFAEQVTLMRQWMKDHGEQNKPLIITEYSLLYPVHYADGSPFFDEYGNQFLPERVSDFMLASFNYLETTKDPDLGYPPDNNRLVQQWLWYAINDESPGTPNNLLNEDYSALTLMGQTYKNHVTARPLSVNLLPTSVNHPVAKTITNTGTTSATLSVTIRNNGNRPVTEPFTVTFRNASTLQLIGSVGVPADLGGCARHEITVSAIWDGLTAGVHKFVAIVDSQGIITESNENDNTMTGYVIVNPRTAYLPHVAR